MEKINTDASVKNAGKLTIWGSLFIRYGLALVLIWIGVLKFTSYEAGGIDPLAKNSPLFSWLSSALGVQGFSQLIGVIEIVVGLLIAFKPLVPKLSAWGSIGAAVVFVITLSFLFSTPGITQEGYSFPFISAMPGQFIIKDFVLLGASLFTAGEAFAAKRQRQVISNIQ